jgi:hypothetical protein
MMKMKRRSEDIVFMKQLLSRGLGVASSRPTLCCQ